MSELRYGLSHFGKTLLWSTSEIYGLYSLTEFGGIPVLAAGIIFVVFLAWSAACDFLVGYIIDRQSNGQAVRLAMFVATPVSGFAFFMTMIPQQFGTGVTLIILASLVFRTTFSVIDVPHNGLLRQLATTPAARVRFSTIRLVAGTCASFSVGIAAMWLIPSGDDADFGLFPIVIAGLATLAFVVSPAIVTQRIVTLSAASQGAAASAQSFPKMVHGLLGYRPFVAILLATMIGVVASSLFLKALPYIGEFPPTVPGWVARAVIAITLGKLLSTPIWYLLARRFGEWRASELAYGLYVLAALLFAFQARDGVLADFAIVLIGGAMGGASVLSWAVLANVVDNIEAKSGTVVQSSIFGLFTCLSKLAVGFGGLAVALLIAFVNQSNGLKYDDGVAGKAFIVISCWVIVFCAIVALTLLCSLRFTRAVTRQCPPQ